MEAKHSTKKTGGSRRKILKKAGLATAFVVPTIMSFKISELHAQNSRAFDRADDNASFK